MMETSIVYFRQNNSYLQYINFHYTYHMYTFLELVTVATHVQRTLRVVQSTKMSCAIKIMHNMQYPVLHTKFNQNTMVVIYMFLLKALHRSTSVPQTNKRLH